MTITAPGGEWPKGAKAGPQHRDVEPPGGNCAEERRIAMLHQGYGRHLAVVQWAAPATAISVLALRSMPFSGVAKTLWNSTVSPA